MVKKQFFLITLCAVLLLPPACQNATERKTEAKAGETAGKMLYRLLATTHFLQHFMLPYDNRFIPDHAGIKLIDSSNKDGNGFVYRVDFGSNGIVCRDGIRRKGAFSIELSDTVRSFSVAGKWQAIPGDSFAQQTTLGWEHFYGVAEITGINTDSALFNPSLHWVYGNQDVHVTAENKVYLIWSQTGTFNQFQTAIRLAGNLKMIGDGAIYQIHSEELVKQAGCLSHWNEGKATLTRISGVDNGENLNIEMDPFGNGACDQVFKVSKKQKTGTLEELFNAW